MKNRFKEITHQLSLQKPRILVAISGGLDSVVLAFLFHQSHWNIILAHCNFQLRGQESDADEAFVKQLGTLWNVKTIVKRFDTEHITEENNSNIQLAARKLRYDWFEQIAQENHCDYIATAHHADDDLETFIINLSRGCGLDGLLGIPEKGKIIRPLLHFSRNEIHQFALENGLSWREDSSNATDKYLRNKIRHHIVPLLKETHPSFAKNFHQTQTYLNQSADFINFYIEKIKQETFFFDNGSQKIRLKALLSHPNLDFLLHKLFYPYHFQNIIDLKKLISAESGKQLLSTTHRLLKDRNYFILEEIKTLTETVHFVNRGNQTIQHPILLEVEHVDKIGKSSENEVFINEDSLIYPLQIRRKKAGDFFYPFGMSGKKKLSKFFKDEKYSLFQKEQQWLLCNGDEIVWIIGKRIDNRYRVDEHTKQILRIRYIPQNNID